MTAQNYTMRTKCIKAQIDNMRQIIESAMWKEMKRLVNKVAQKEDKASHDCAGKVMHWELCKRLKLDSTT